MSSYLERLKAVLAENMSAEGTDKTDKSPSVSFVSDRDAHVSRDEGATIAALPQGEPKQSGVAGVAASPAWRFRLHELPTAPCPHGFPPQRWPVMRDGAERFAQQWGGKAMGLGWAFGELFDLAEPFANVSLQGAAWFVGESTVTAITADAITLRTEGGATQRIHRKHHVQGPPL
jgi:hypothetical protein